MRRDWSAVIARHHGDPCIVCGSDAVEYAHLAPRANDARHGTRRQRQGTVVRVDPDLIVPLCLRDHCAFDRGAFDLLPFLRDAYPEKVTATVAKLGMEEARRRLVPSDYSPAIVAARGGGRWAI